MLLRIMVTLFFFISIAFLPWWCAAALAIILIAYWGDWWFVLVGGLTMDITFGAPIPALFGFAYLYVTLFGFLALLATVLRQRMLE